MKVLIELLKEGNMIQAKNLSAYKIYEDTPVEIWKREFKFLGVVLSSFEAIIYRHNGQYGYMWPRHRDRRGMPSFVDTHELKAQGWEPVSRSMNNKIRKTPYRKVVD